MSNRPRYFLLSLFLGAAVCVLPAKAQVSVAPTALFLDDQDRFGALYIGNQTATPQEVTIGFRFGYTTTDSTGGVYIEFEDSTAAEKYSIAPHVRAFPERFMLPPGETQVVRLTARPPADFEEGWLWSRVLTTSTPQVEFQDTTSTGVQANLIFRLQQVTALFYTKGSSDASLAVEGLSARVDSNEVVVMADLDKTGDRPFFGRAFLRIKDSGGEQLAEDMTLVAVYVPEQRRFVAPLPDNLSPDSDLQAELTIVPDRTDIPERYVLSSSPIVATTSVRP